MMLCQRCRHVLPDGTIFCDHCGTQQLVHQVPGSGVSLRSPSPAHATPATLKVRLLLRDGTVFDLTEPREYIIGRRDQADAGYKPDIDLTQWNGAERGVSRRHAKVTTLPDAVFIEDLGSVNKTLQNGYRLVKGQRYPLAHGDELRFGLITLWVAITAS